MFGLFTRSRTKTPKRPRRSVPLSLERLETRDCPSGGPLIMSLNIAALNDGRRVEITGTVEDDSAGPGSVCLNFSGVATGQVYADAVGQFDYITTATGLGTVTAVGVDGDGLASPPRNAVLAVAPPTLSLNVAYGTQRNVTLSGTVTAGQPGGLTVTFSGKAGGSAATDAYGKYSLATQASGLGTVTASVTDAWGQTGTAQATLSSSAPVIDSFTARQSTGNMWIFQGHVTDESPAGLTVQLSGLPGLSGVTATVQSDGTFWVGVQLARGTSGLAQAQVTDWWGLDSNIATFMVMA